VLLEPQEAAAAVRSPGARNELSVLRDRPFIAIDLRKGDDGAELTPLRELPAVIIGVGAPHDACDIAVASTEALEPVVVAVGANPQAAVTLVQLLRLSSRLDPHAGLVAESLAYATLQGGREFRAWLARRGRRVRRAGPEPPVISEREGSTLALILNRPRLHNLYDATMRDALVDGLSVAAHDRSIDQLVLRGRGKSFCAGGDLAEFGTVSDPATAHLIRTTANAAPYLLAVAGRLRAEVHGAVVGAGLELAAFASRVIAAPDAIFQLPEVSMGLVPGAGGTVSVPARIGRHRAAWLMLTAARIDAATALDWGLIDEVSPERVSG
jgi:enoyl-CoA hydratase/carnithine racemase